MKELKRDLLTNKYTKIYHEDESEIKYGAPHHFVVTKADMGLVCGNKSCPYALAPSPQCPFALKNRPKCKHYIEQNAKLCEINFQEGPIKECGVNGVCNEDLINMVIERLECFQNTEFKCRENALAITKLEEALLWLRKRTMSREQKGIEGTHIVDVRKE